MSAHRQNHTPASGAGHQAAGVGLAVVIGIALALLILHWSCQ